MDILITERPSENGYIESLIKAYSRAGNTVICDASNFFYSNHVPDVLHIHWPERLYQWSPPTDVNQSEILDVIEERLVWYRNHGVTILNTIHNLQPHDSTLEVGKQAYRLVIKYADILVHHCDKSVSLLSDKYPEVTEKTNIVCPHGDYRIHYRNPDPVHARRAYGLPEDKIIILNFGRQRPYKNGDFIISAFDKLGVSSKYLVIAGVLDYPDNGRMKNLRFRISTKVRKSLKYADRKFIYRHFSNAEISDIVSCADIIFLGQNVALNSGLLPLAATFGRPVVCPDTGCFREAVSEWCHEMYEPGDIASASNALQRMCKKVLDVREGAEPFDNTRWLSENSWEKHAGIILSHLPSTRRR